MPGDVDTLPDPPEPPEIRRSLSLYRFQLIGLPFLLAIPLLALFGVFGERWQDVRSSQGVLEVSGRYPAVFRYKMIDAIELHVRNRGDAVIDTITVALDTAYAARFSTITAVPPFTGPFELDLTAVEPGASRRVRIEIQAERYWSHSGHVTVAAGSDTIRIPLTTVVYP
jgi:hypothetical protein